jgi:hypothetical protein
MEREEIVILLIVLDWTDWVAWTDVELDARTYPARDRLPDTLGVYEAKYRESDERLTIGKAASLRMRVKQGLVKGKVGHRAGEQIRAKEDTTQLVVRWAATERTAAAEEDLHLRYRSRFGRLPKYTYFSTTVVVVR